MFVGLWVALLLGWQIAECTKDRPGCHKVLGSCGNDTSKDNYDCCLRDYESPCNLVDCQSGYTCRLVMPNCDEEADVECSREPEAQCTRIVHCPMERICKPPQYVIYQTNGCKTCSADSTSNPCVTAKCSAGHECVAVQVQCIAAPCNPVAQCRKICEPPPKKCHKGCAMYYDSDGCQHCYCCNACATHKCKEDEECALEKVTCKTDPCPPQAVCIKD